MVHDRRTVAFAFFTTYLGLVVPARCDGPSAPPNTTPLRTYKKNNIATRRIMEFAYDHIQEEIVAQDTSNDKGKDPEKPQESLNEEFQEAYKAFSASPWGARVGSFIGTVKKQVGCSDIYTMLESR